MFFSLIYAFMLGLLTIVDPCTLFTSIAAIGYIDKEVSNKRRVMLNGTMFVLGKIVIYCALSIPFYLGAQTDKMQHLLEHYGEPVMAAFMLLCGIFLLFSGHLHHTHDHGIMHRLEKSEQRWSWLWSFLLGAFFAIAFCPHRLIYFITMIDAMIGMPSTFSWLMPLIFSLGTGLPILIVAIVLAYSATSIAKLTNSITNFEKWFRYACAFIFIAVGIYLTIHIIVEHGFPL